MFYFEYSERKYDGYAWSGGEWQLYNNAGKEMQIRISLVPVASLNFLSFRENRPKPDELLVVVVRHIELDMTDDQASRLTNLLEEAYLHQFRSDLTDGAKLEVDPESLLGVFLTNLLTNEHK